MDLHTGDAMRVKNSIFVLALSVLAAAGQIAMAQQPAGASSPGDKKAAQQRDADAPRFTKVADGVRDKEQGVVWAEKDNGADINWTDADQYCRALGKGWKLPTVLQLQSLYDASGSNAQRLSFHYDQDYTATIKPATRLIQFTGYGYWTSEHSTPREVWGVILADGSKGPGNVFYATTSRALCVRRS
jgi:hypothetical protein